MKIRQGFLELQLKMSRMFLRHSVYSMSIYGSISPFPKFWMTMTFVPKLWPWPWYLGYLQYHTSSSRGWTNATIRWGRRFTFRSHTNYTRGHAVTDEHLQQTERDDHWVLGPQTYSCIYIYSMLDAVPPIHAESSRVKSHVWYPQSTWQWRHCSTHTFRPLSSIWHCWPRDLA